MAGILDKVKTVVLLMFENRSFDHMLGHLSYERINTAADGLSAPLSNYNNIYQGDQYNAFAMKGDTQLPFDLPHEYNEVDVQLARSAVTGNLTMSGFVEAYAAATGVVPNANSQPMGFFKSSQVPVTSFLANNFCCCDRWFAPIPTSTQPNRNMAFFGDTNRHFTKAGPATMTNSIFDWMNKMGIRWRVYHDGLSFFALYPSQWKHVLGGNFRPYEKLAADMLNEPAGKAPQVIIVEPSYQDAPHIGSDRPNDNHAPLAIGWGEELLRNTYRAVSANAAKWANTVMITYYDEHGGFYDHVPPPAIAYKTKANPAFTFNSTGPRIPGIIASPLVEPGSVCHSLFDHTSVLYFLSEKFAPGNFITPTVSQRHSNGIASISAALSTATSQPAPVIPATPISVQTALGVSVATPPQSNVAAAFEVAANQLLKEHPAEVAKKMPELILWKHAVDQHR